MAISGLFLIVFLFVHLAGNLLILKNDNGASFNSYSEALVHNPLIRIIEIFLVLGFFMHIYYAIALTISNKSARGNQYKVSIQAGSWFSRNMDKSGGIILAFLLLHIKSFFVKHRILETNDSMYQSTIDLFHNPFFVVFYVISMVLLAFHLLHGFQSTFQSLGLRHEKYSPIIRNMGYFVALFIPFGFAFIPLYVYFN